MLYLLDTKFSFRCNDTCMQSGIILRFAANRNPHVILILNSVNRILRSRATLLHPTRLKVANMQVDQHPEKVELRDRQGKVLRYTVSVCTLHVHHLPPAHLSPRPHHHPEKTVKMRTSCSCAYICRMQSSSLVPRYCSHGPLPQLKHQHFHNPLCILSAILASIVYPSLIIGHQLASS